MIKVKEIKPLPSYQLWLSFSDGKNGIVDFRPFLDKGISLTLLKDDYFAKVTIDEFGGICWDNGFDFSPQTLRSLLK